MLDQTPPVDTREPIKQAVVEPYKKPEGQFEDIHFCKNYPEAEAYRKEHGGFISTDGTKWVVVYVRKK